MDLQKLADELCRALGRSVAVDDHDLQVVVASAQVGLIDVHRSEAVLKRRTTPEVVAYGLSQTAGRGPDPFLVAANPELGTLSRWCFPLHQGTDTLGYLWLIDEPGLTASDKELAVEYAEKMALVLAADRREVTESARRSEHFLSRMISSRTAEDFHEIARQSSLSTEGTVTLWCFEVQVVSESTRHRAEVLRMARVVDRILSDPRMTNLLTAHLDDHIAVATSSTRSPEDLSKTLIPMVQRAATGQGMTVSACGWEQPGEDFSPSVSWQRAKFAARISRLFPDGSARGWEQLGAWYLLYQQEWSPQIVTRLSPRCRRLITHENPEMWRTLLAYLDAACDITTTCTALHIQRATLYYRLKRIREIAGDELLSEGWERTSGHLALKLHSALTHEPRMTPAFLPERDASR